MVLNLIMMIIKKYNVIFGVIISSIIIFLLYITIPILVGLFQYGDIYVILGTFIGCYISFKYRTEQQSFIKIGVIIGVGSACLSTILISIFYSNDIISFFLIFLLLFLFYVVFGAITGYFVGFLYKRKEEKSKSLDF
jgi:hypothetical protein